MTSRLWLFGLHALPRASSFVLPSFGLPYCNSIVNKHVGHVIGMVKNLRSIGT